MYINIHPCCNSKYVFEYVVLIALCILMQFIYFLMFRYSIHFNYSFQFFGSGVFNSLFFIILGSQLDDRQSVYILKSLFLFLFFFNFIYCIPFQRKFITLYINLRLLCFLMLLLYCWYYLCSALTAGSQANFTF